MQKTAPPKGCGALLAPLPGRPVAALLRFVQPVAQHELCGQGGATWPMWQTLLAYTTWLEHPFAYTTPFMHEQPCMST